LLHKYEKTLEETGFCKHICELFRKRSKVDLLRDRITNEMAIHLYVLGPLMKDKIVDYVNSSLIIIVHRH